MRLMTIIGFSSLIILFATLACSHKAKHAADIIDWMDEEYMLKNEGWIPTEQEIIAQIERLAAEEYFCKETDLYMIEAAAALDKPVVLRYLLDQGVSPNPESRGVALCQAIQSGNQQSVLALIDYGANLNAVSGSNDDTPLHWAAYEGEYWAVDLLISKGANPNIENRKGLTVVDFANNNSDIELQRRFKVK
ncbi:MAG: ankyrin repeat domain-containing protein [Phycisphaeraceae bacterium]